MEKNKSFEGKSTTSIEDAIKNAISLDPKGDPHTDIFLYKVADIKCEWGGMVPTTTYMVTLERTKE